MIFYALVIFVLWTISFFFAGIEAGLTFSGAFFAAAGTVVDYSISYVVTAPKGFLINDAVSSGVFSTFNVRAFDEVRSGG